MWLSLDGISGFFSAVARLECFSLPPTQIRLSFKVGLSFVVGHDLLDSESCQVFCKNLPLCCFKDNIRCLVHFLWSTS